MAAARPSSEVDICNLALDLINQDDINSIEAPTTKTEKQCARWYPLCRASLLRKHPWKFATKRTTLASAAAADYPLPFGYTTAWKLPSDFIRLIGLGDDITGLMTDDSGRLNFRYLYDVSNVSQFDALFVEILAMNIALKLARKASASDTRIQDIKDELKKVTPAGFSVDGQERPPTRIQRSRWTQRRRMNGSRGYGTPWVGDLELSSKIQYQLENGYILTGLF